ncbi:SapC family protein [Sphingosinicella sp. BN140058]|uniref:SapC family protein n=1 Tax=Sphingosinicella sp. BN140058 TaxID=1892855 RepID=UPI0010139500|nr:SapC family protein [Sphingosinicella sp. BN140058]QAY75271.1 multidrug transporter [Sphingosinicella sp. BN140058]
MSEHAILDTAAHRDLRIRTDRSPELGDAMMCCITVPAEFRQVQNEYAILFRLNLERDAFTALAMFGFEAGENLYLENGRWDARYIPLAADIQPFLIGGAIDGTGPRQVHIDMASPRIAGEEGMRLFDEFGQPTPYLDGITEKLGALDEGYQGSAAFLDALKRHDLLEPMSLEVTLDNGSTNRLVGFHVIDEDRLRALDAQSLSRLHADGHLMPIFMAVASLANLGALVARKNRRLAYG